MPDPHLLVAADRDELGRVGADLVAEAIAASPSPSITVATGMSPMGLYSELATRHQYGALDIGEVTVFQLDEYLGLESGDRRSLLGWMRRSFLEPLEIHDDRVVALPLDGEMPEACAAFDRAIEARGQLDLAILGLGHNGHLGFNEPPSGPKSPTRVVELSSTTQADNARYWGHLADVPTRAVTMGLHSLLHARQILLVVCGEAKRAILRRTLDGRLDPDVPASYLRTAEGEVTVLVDSAAWSNG